MTDTFSVPGSEASHALRIRIHHVHRPTPPAAYINRQTGSTVRAVHGPGPRTEAWTPRDDEARKWAGSLSRVWPLLCLAASPCPLLPSSTPVARPAPQRPPGREGRAAGRRIDRRSSAIWSVLAPLSLVLLSGCLKNQFCACFLFFL